MAAESRSHSQWVVVGAWVGALACAAHAATPGYVADFNGGDFHGFSSGATNAVVPADGVGGAGDGYLEVSRALSSRLGSKSGIPEFTGDLVADGVTGFSFWLNDVGTDENLEIHVGVGQAFVNFWLSVDGFSPPENGWAEFSVDITNEANWVQIIGAGTFQDALANSDRLLFRHDTAPLEQFPNQIVGDFGVDRITVLPAGPVPTLSEWGALAMGILLLTAGTVVFGRRRRVAPSAA